MRAMVDGTHRWLALAALLLAAVLALASPPAAAQLPAPAATAPAAAPGIDTAEIERLVATIEDPAKRAALVASLKALIAAGQAQPVDDAPKTLSTGIIRVFTESWQATRTAMTQLADEVADWPAKIGGIGEGLIDAERRRRNADAVMAFIGIFVGGWLAEALLWWLLTGPRRSVEAGAQGAEGGWGRAWLGAVRVLLDLVPVAVFAVSAYLIALLVEPPRPVQAMALNFVNAYAIGRGTLAFLRMLMSPSAPALRPLPLEDAAARDLYAWIRRFVIVGVAGYFVIAAAVLLGLPRRSTALLFDGLYLALAIMAVVMIVSRRQPVAAWIAGLGRAPDDADGTAARRPLLAPLLDGLAPVWHILAVLYVVAFFAISAFAIEGGFAYMARGTAATLAAVALTGLALRLLRGGAAPAPTAPGDAARPGQRLTGRLQGYLPLVRWLAAAAVVAIGLVLLLEGWGGAAVDWLLGPHGQRLLGAAASIMLTAGVAVLAWEAASGAIERYMAGGGGRTHGARARTLLPLLRKTLLVFLTVMVALITLSEIGINIAPLLAGAGVAGLAIGFGAQRLVQDVITGFFMLVEDAVAVGDVVSVAGVSGVVEDMSVRALKLRDVAGALHTVPFSTVNTVSNMTKDFSYYVLDIGVAYDEDPDRVADVCRAIVEEMRGEPAFARAIVAPLDVFGLDSFGESAIVVKARIKTVPMQQWAVGRAFNRRMKQRFDALGIQFPYPQRTIHLAGGALEAPVATAPGRTAATAAAMPAPAATTTAEPPPPTLAKPRRGPERTEDGA